MSDLDYNKLLKRVQGLTSTKIVDEERLLKNFGRKKIKKREKIKKKI